MSRVFFKFLNRFNRPQWGLPPPWMCVLVWSMVCIAGWHGFSSNSVRAQTPDTNIFSSANLVWNFKDRERIEHILHQGRSQEALDELLHFGTTAYGQTDYDYLLGVAALESSQYNLALEALERVVLMNPQHAGAWLDLALVHYRLQDYETSHLMMVHVQENFDPTPVMARQLNQLQKKMRWAPYTKDWLLELSAYTGYVNNANAGLNNLNFSLTPPGGLPVNLQADQKQASRSDKAYLLRANAYRLINHEAGSYSEVMVSLGARQYDTEKSFSLNDLGLMWLYSQAWQGFEWQAGPSLRQIFLGGRYIGDVYGVQTTLWTNQSKCRWGPRAEIEFRNYHQEGYYSSQTPWVGGVARCEHGDLIYGASIRRGLEQSEANRPGGNSTKSEFLLLSKYRFNPDWSLDGSLGYSKYTDRDTYSYFLANGATRTIDRWLGRVGLEWHAQSIGYKNLYVSTYFDYYKDKSNISFSNIQDKQLFMGLRYLVY